MNAVKLTKSVIAAGLLGAGMITPAFANTVIDNYVGSNDHGYGDVIAGSGDHRFDVFSMDISLSGSILTVSINTNFAGRGDDGLFSGYTVGGTGIGYGDLFLSSAWAPFGASPYSGDSASNGTVWTYGLSLDNRFGNGGVATLYSLNSGNNLADALLSDDFMTGATYRNGQEVAVNTAQGNVTAITNGSWSLGAGTVNFTVDISGTSLLAGSEIAAHWGMTCANDVIEGSVPNVPVPAAVWLFGSGLIGLVGVARRKAA